MDHDHTPDAIRARLEAGPKHSYLRDWVYGGIDGAVTTFAVVAGVTGAELASSVIVILGAANLVNSLLGRRFALLPWGVAFINAGICLYWVLLLVSAGWIRSTFAILIQAAFLALLILSTLLARVWGKAAAEAIEAG